MTPPLTPPHSVFLAYCGRMVSAISNVEVVWCQEEPMNMGAYSYISPHLCPHLSTIVFADDIEYVGRVPSAATATGFSKGQTELL
uniref:2-oxoglutarate dehydrogenase E1 component/KDG C-terminal domain-containing protein n=1 Tax=Chenopodium quinoa TaxID=63459 RepID=A0A803N1N8_CHEQI